jgi:periplasmic divalent cation tolerance protein
MNQKKLNIVITTFPDQAHAEKVANLLIEEKLAACVQIDSPVTSIYSWQGKVEREKEVRVWIKCQAERLSELESKVKQHHPYEIPQWIVLQADQVSEAYLDWVYEGHS